LTLSAEKLNESLRAERKALVVMKALNTKLAEEESTKAIAEYRDSKVLKEEISKLFQIGYDFCLGLLRDLHPNYDLSGLRDDTEGEDVADVDAEDEDITEVINDVLATAIEEGLEATTEAVISETHVECCSDFVDLGDKLSENVTREVGTSAWGRSLARLRWCVRSCGVLWRLCLALLGRLEAGARLASRGSGWCVLLLAASGGGLVAVVVTILVLGCQSMVAPTCVVSRPRDVVLIWLLRGLGGCAEGCFYLVPYSVGFCGSRVCVMTLVGGRGVALFWTGNPYWALFVRLTPLLPSARGSSSRELGVGRFAETVVAPCVVSISESECCELLYLSELRVVLCKFLGSSDPWVAMRTSGSLAGFGRLHMAILSYKSTAPHSFHVGHQTPCRLTIIRYECWGDLVFFKSAGATSSGWPPSLSILEVRSDLYDQVNSRGRI
ncbi:hypothetical protein Taro_049577, partial [Colocasia esculenta]|nr:hypothetical protein [Colocasia esculenta]